MNTKGNYCGSADHSVQRRAFLATLGMGTAALAGSSAAPHLLAADGLTKELKKQGRRVILLWLAGGASQLETWDPKPGRPTGGPFAAIPTDVPGVHISELMPLMARRMKHSCLIRSLNTRDAGHGSGAQLMMRGRRDEAALKYPDLGAILARELGRADSAVPDYVNFYPSTEGRGQEMLSPAFLGGRFGAINLYDQSSPPNLARPEQISQGDHAEREQLREWFSHRFEKGRDLPTLRSHAAAYARVTGLMSSQKLFDNSGESKATHELYGPSQFGQQVLMARRMVESGVPFVRVGRAWWDSHGQNFETHGELVPELDRVLAALIDDLKQRGLLESTLIVTVGEFGRTPAINASLGRDHFASAWSASLHGCGVKAGAVWGKTDEDGNKVVEGEVGAGELFATILSAAGIDPRKEYHVGSRPVPLVNPGIKPITQVLA